MVTKIFRFRYRNIQSKYCDVYISVSIVKKKSKKKYIINLNFKYSDSSLESTKANPLYLKGVKRDELNGEIYELKYNDFNYGLVDYLLMDLDKLTQFSGYKSSYEYKKELIQFLDVEKYCY